MRSSSATDAKIAAFVILHRNPTPVSSPVSTHHHEKAGLFSSASQSVQSDAAQKKIEGASIVISSAPALKMGETHITTTVPKATRPS